MAEVFQMSEEYYTRDYSMEPGASHVGQKKYASSFTKPMKVKVYPNSSSSISVAATGNSSSIIFNLPRAGYYCGWAGSEGYLEVTATPSAACQMEIYGSLARMDQTYNGTIITGKFNHPYRAACNEILDRPLSKLQIEGAMYGIGATGNQYEPFCNGIATTQPVVTSGATAAAAGNYVGTGGRSFLLPFKINADGLLADPDSLTPLALLNSNQIEVSFLGTQSWCSNMASSPAAVTVTISNPILYITRTAVSSDLNNLYQSLMAEGRLAIHTTSKVTTGFAQTVAASTADVNIQFTSLPKVIKYMEVSLESPVARTNNSVAYKALTTLQCGITSFRFFIDNEPVTDKPVDVTKYEAYATYENMRYNRLKAQKDIQSLANAAISPYIHSGLGSSLLNAYPTCDLDSGTDYIVFNSAFRCCADLGSINSSWYSGTTGRVVDFSYTTGSAVSYYNTSASTQTAITQVMAILICHAPSRLILGLGSAIFEV